MIAEVQVISNHGWNMMYLLFGAGVGMVGAVLMMVYQETLEDREANEAASDEADGARRDRNTETGR